MSEGDKRAIQCWPGFCSFIFAMNPFKAIKYMFLKTALVSDLKELGVDYYLDKLRSIKKFNDIDAMSAGFKEHSVKDLLNAFEDELLRSFDYDQEFPRVKFWQEHQDFLEKTGLSLFQATEIIESLWALECTGHFSRKNGIAEIVNCLELNEGSGGTITKDLELD